MALNAKGYASHVTSKTILLAHLVVERLAYEVWVREVLQLTPEIGKLRVE